MSQKTTSDNSAQSTAESTPESTPEITPATAADAPPATPVEPDRRQSVLDRRMGVERRGLTPQPPYTGPERRKAEDRRGDSGLERRRGPGRRRNDDRRSAEEGEMTPEQFEFVMAIQMY
jgi:hypothetical protein